VTGFRAYATFTIFADLICRYYVTLCFFHFADALLFHCRCYDAALLMRRDATRARYAMRHAYAMMRASIADDAVAFAADIFFMLRLMPPYFDVAPPYFRDA